MKKCYQLLVLLLVFISNVAYADKIELNLREFASVVASDNNVNILIQQEIEDEKVFFHVGDINTTKISLDVFSKMLFLKGFDLKKTHGFYFVQKIVKPEEKPIENVFKKIDLKNAVWSDVESVLKTYDVNASTYVSSTNSVLFSAHPKKVNEIENAIRLVDVPLNQVQFKITVLETSMTEIKDRGFNLSAITHSTGSSSDISYYLNLITMPYSTSTNVSSSSNLGFYAVVKYLNENGYTQVKNSPVITARNQTEVSFKSVKNIPYKINSSSYANASTTTSTAYSYKDVGLQVAIKPIVIDDKINFDLTLTIEDLLDTTDTPTTSKKELKSTYVLNKGEILVLSGINKESIETSDFNVPGLSNIFVLGEFFKYKSTSKQSTVMTMAIELL